MTDRRLRGRRLGAGVIVLALGAAAVWAIGGLGGATRAGGAARSSAERAPAAGKQVGGSAEGRAVDRVLAYTGYVTTGTARRREIALTFDDGPGPSTAGVLAVLHKLRAPATFFEIGRAARANPRLVRRVLAAGLPIGDHTESHALLLRLGAAAQQSEIDQGALDIKHQGARYPRLFRPPFGGFNADTLRLVRARRMLMVLWTVDSKDFTRPGVKRIVYVAVSGARPGAIILFHDGGGDRSQTVAALPRIISLLRRRHYRLVTVPRLLLDDPPAAGQPAPRSLAGV